VSRTLLLLLEGPFQSWGAGSRNSHRGTERRPTKSGVIGLLAAALGRSREDPLGDLRELQFAVRIDEPGAVTTDYQTTLAPDGESLISHRDYLTGAVFVAALHGPEDTIERVAAALQEPMFALFLGRKACTLSSPPFLRLTDEPLLEAITNEPWHSHARRYGKPPETLEVIADDPDGAERSHDDPVSYSAERRVYLTRRHTTHRVPRPEKVEAS